jgi:hypothetical protein
MERKIVNGIVNVSRDKTSIVNQSVVLCCPNSKIDERERIIEDILSSDYGCDCVVRYVENAENADNADKFAKSEIERLVKNSALLVFYVNQKTIDDRNIKKSDEIYPEYYFAKKNNVTVIPIVNAGRKRDFTAAFEKDDEINHVIQYLEVGKAKRRSEYELKLKKELNKHITSIKDYFFVKHWHLMTAILLFIAAVLLDMRHILFPGLVINAPSMDSCWNMFEAQVGISAVGLTIVSLIISIVSISTYGMSLPEFIMKIRPKKYLRYTFVVSSIIAAVVINWAMLIFGMEFTAIYIFVLTSILAVYLTYSAMQIIYVKDNIKTEVREYIIDIKRPGDIDNLYKAMSKDIKTGDFIEFMENLEFAEEMLSFEIDNWEKDLDTNDKEKNYKPKSHGEKFKENLEFLIDSAIDTDNSRIPVEIMEFYYKALDYANKENVCIEWECYDVIINLLKVIDFEYLEHIKTNRECNYEEFLKAQFRNHSIIETEKHNKNDDNYDRQVWIYITSFFYQHYVQLIIGKYKNNVSRQTEELINFASKTKINYDTDIYKLFFFYEVCFLKPEMKSLYKLVHVHINFENSTIIMNKNINNSINWLENPDFPITKDVYITILLYSFKVSNLKDENLYSFVDDELNNFYRQFYKVFLGILFEKKIYLTTFKNYWKEFKKIVNNGGFFIDMKNTAINFKKFIVYSIICKLTKIEDIISSLEYVFQDEFYGQMFVEFLSYDGLYTDKGLIKFCDVFKIYVFDFDIYNTINEKVITIINKGMFEENKEEISAMLSEAFAEDKVIQERLMRVLSKVLRDRDYSVFEDALIDALKDRKAKIIFTDLRTELSKTPENDEKMILPL